MTFNTVRDAKRKVRGQSTDQTRSDHPRDDQGAQQHVSRRSNRWRSSWRRVFGLDLVLLHAPSVWDFREEIILQGPLADVIPVACQSHRTSWSLVLPVTWDHPDCQS
jgi:hypothetical protein